MFIYGETVLGMTDDAVIAFFKIPSNKAVFEEIKRETFPQFVQPVKPDETETKTSKTKN